MRRVDSTARKRNHLLTQRRRCGACGRSAPNKAICPASEARQSKQRRHKAMRGATQMMGRALLGALVLAWMATAGWSQSLRLGWARWAAIGAEAYGVSADGSVVVGYGCNAAGRRAFRWTASGGMQDLGTLGGRRARLMVFPPTAPWWSAGLPTPQGRSCLSLDGVGWDARPRHAGRRSELGLWRFSRRLRGGRLGFQRRRV
jgi:probable HAF family extracellular repeat protein